MKRSITLLILLLMMLMPIYGMDYFLMDYLNGNGSYNSSCGMVDTVNHGFIRIDKNKRYFVFDDGTPYIPIGLDEFRLFRQSKRTIDSLMTLYAAHGINHISVAVDEHVQELEFPAGVYKQAQLDKLDFIIKRAQDLGIYINLSLLDDNGIKSDFAWRLHPYNALNGGPAKTQSDMYDTTDTATWKAVKSRFKKIVQRYENYRSIMMWTLANDCIQSENWKTGMYDFVKEIDQNKHIITIGYNTGKDPGGEMDCGSVRTYNYNPDGNDPEVMTKTLDERIRQALKSGDPVYVGGGRMDYSSGGAYNAERGFLHLMWEPIASGAAGNTLWWVEKGSKKWPYLSDQELDWMFNFSRFCKTIDWSNFNSINVNNEIHPADSNIVAFACRDTSQMLIYLMNDDPAKQFNELNTSITVDAGLNNHAYTVTWIDIRTGNPIIVEKVEHVPFTVSVPAFKDGLFAYISKEEYHIGMIKNEWNIKSKYSLIQNSSSRYSYQIIISSQLSSNIYVPFITDNLMD